MSNFREASRINYRSADTTEHINAGSLQRIADATEIMAKNYLQLQADRERYERFYKDERVKNGHLERSIRAYKAHNTRLRNKLASLETMPLP